MTIGPQPTSFRVDVLPSSSPASSSSSPGIFECMSESIVEQQHEEQHSSSRGGGGGDRGHYLHFSDVGNTPDCPAPSEEAQEKHASFGFSSLSLRTRAPLWNTETGCFLHNFGSRVKRASNHNFVCIRDWNGEKDVVEEEKRVYLRFGKLLHNTYVLDVRESIVSLIVALGAVASELTTKTLCAR